MRDLSLGALNPPKLIVLQIKETLRCWGPCSKRLCLLQALLVRVKKNFKKKNQEKNIIYSFLQLFPRDLKCALHCGLRQSKPGVQTCLSPSQDLHLAVAQHLEVAPHLAVVLARLRLGLLHLAPEYPLKAWEEGDYAKHFTFYGVYSCELRSLG